MVPPWIEAVNSHLARRVHSLRGRTYTSTSAVGINDKRKAVEWADGVDAGSANCVLAVIGVP